MLNRISILTLLTLVSALSAGTAQAQLNPDSVVRSAEREIFGKDKRTGHDKCAGQGHEKGKGSGHDEDECEEPAEPTPSGPIGETVCAAPVDPESAYQRFSCELSIVAENYTETTAEAVTVYASDVGSYVESTSASLLAFADGALGLVAPIGPPNPPVIEALVADPVNYSTTYAFETSAIVESYTETTATRVLDFADGALGLVAPIGPPNPPVMEALIADPVNYSTAYAAVLTDYALDVGSYVEITSATLLDYADGALGLVAPIGPPNPPVMEALVADPVDYSTTYAFETSEIVATYTETTAIGVLDFADGALGLVAPIGPPNPPVKEVLTDTMVFANQIVQ